MNQVVQKYNYYLVQNKDDDYGNSVRELVRTSHEFAEQYYAYDEVPEEDVSVLKKYFEFTDYDEEKERTEDRRFYGTVEE